MSVKSHGEWCTANETFHLDSKTTSRDAVHTKNWPSYESNEGFFFQVRTVGIACLSLKVQPRTMQRKKVQCCMMRSK